MDDSKSKNPNEMPENTGTQPTAEEVPATVTDGTEAAAQWLCCRRIGI